jgi:NitT/TauT family transport system substrate-binding protein
MKHRKHLLKLGILAALLIVILSLAGCGTKAETNPAVTTPAENPSAVTTVKIGYLPLTHAVPLFIEDELAELAEENVNLELVKFGSWTELVDALNTGNIDGASMLIELAMKARTQGIDLKAVALGHRDGNVVVVSNEINSPEDLRGKTFAIPHSLSTHNVLLHLMLKNSGMTYGDLNVIELPPPEMPAALSEGRIAGYIVAEPFGARAVVSGKGKTLYESGDLWEDSVCCGLILRNDFIERNPVAADAFVSDYIRAGQKAEAKDKTVGEIASKYMKVEPEVLELSLKWISYENLRLEEEDYNQLSDYMIEMGLIENPPAYMDFVDNRFIDAVK